jgi:hypothetical protein
MTTHLDDAALHDHLHLWVDASLISPDEADAIETFEHVTQPEAVPTPRRIPLVTEALAYVGIALAAAAGAVLLGDRWDEFTPAARAISIGASAAVVFLAGLSLLRSQDEAIARLASILWLIATGLLAADAFLIAHDVLDMRGRAPTFVMGVTTTIVGGALYAIRRRGPQQVGLLAGLFMLAGVVSTDLTVAFGAVWVVAVAWVVLGLAHRLPPSWTALVTGAVAALYAPLMMQQGSSHVGMWLGLATGVAFIVASVLLHETVLLAFGAVGAFVYLIQVIARLFGGTAGMPIALLAVGAVVLATAVWLARRSTRTGPRSPA